MKGRRSYYQPIAEELDPLLSKEIDDLKCEKKREFEVYR